MPLTVSLSKIAQILKNWNYLLFKIKTNQTQFESIADHLTTELNENRLVVKPYNKW